MNDYIRVEVEVHEKGPFWTVRTVILTDGEYKSHVWYAKTDMRFIECVGFALEIKGEYERGVRDWNKRKELWKQKESQEKLKPIQFEK